MRIGVVSDTHDNAKNVSRIVDLFLECGIERLVHTGDITRGRTLEQLSGIGVPIFGVYGNNDVLREELDETAHRLGVSLAEPPFEAKWQGRRLLVVHDPRDFERTATAEHHLLLHGHTHRRVVDREGERLVFNPGECAGQLEGHNAVGVVDLKTLIPEVLFF